MKLPRKSALSLIVLFLPLVFSQCFFTRQPLGKIVKADWLVGTWRTTEAFPKNGPPGAGHGPEKIIIGKIGGFYALQTDKIAGPVLFTEVNGHLLANFLFNYDNDEYSWIYLLFYVKRHGPDQLEYRELNRQLGKDLRGAGLAGRQSRYTGFELRQKGPKVAKAFLKIFDPAKHTDGSRYFKRKTTEGSQLVGPAINPATSVGNKTESKSP